MYINREGYDAIKKKLDVITKHNPSHIAQSPCENVDVAKSLGWTEGMQIAPYKSEDIFSVTGSLEPYSIMALNSDTFGSPSLNPFHQRRNVLRLKEGRLPPVDWYNRGPSMYDLEALFELYVDINRWWQFLSEADHDQGDEPPEYDCDQSPPPYSGYIPGGLGRVETG